MLVIASRNGERALPTAMGVLRDGGSAVDAVEAGIRLVESDASEESVGVGGIPNLLGDLELDASIMEGNARKSGAVAAIRGYEHPISIARQVMERLPYELLVGPGAELFAAECGFQTTETRTPEAMGRWSERLGRLASSELLAKLVRRQGMLEATHALWDEIAGGHGTTNLIAMDRTGNMASGVSTTGLALKYPGRVGDSPIIGAGNYADSRYGAVACTGYGEMAIRTGLARCVVLMLQMCVPLDQAVVEAMQDVVDLALPWRGGINLIALNADGRHAGASTRPDDAYVYMSGEMDHVAHAVRHHVPLGEFHPLRRTRD